MSAVDSGALNKLTPRLVLNLGLANIKPRASPSLFRTHLRNYQPAQAAVDSHV